MATIEEINNQRGWVAVVICFVTLAVTFGARSSVSMVLPFWQVELGWTGSEVATGASIVFTMMALGSPIAGNLMDRYGARYVLAGGLVALAFGVGATAFVMKPIQYFIFFGVIGGVGWASVSIPMVTAAVSGYFKRMRGLAIGFAVAGASGGQLPVISGLGVIVAEIGWRSSYQILSVLMLLLALLIFLRIKPPERGLSDCSSISEELTEDSLYFRLSFLFSNRTFLLLLGSFSLCGFTTAGVIDVYFIPYSISCGFSLVESSAAYGVHGLGNLFGVIFFSWLADHVHRSRLLATMFFLRGFAFILLLFVASDISVLFVFALVFGILNFATFPVIAHIVATHIGARILGLTLGLLFGGHSLGAAIGIMVGGSIFDLTGDYTELWYCSAVLAIGAGLLAIFIKETELVNDQPV